MNIFKKKMLNALFMTSALLPAFAQAVEIPCIPGINCPKPTPGGSGTLNLSGEVINAACSISSDSSDQSIKLGSATVTALNAGKTAQKEFTIKLDNCDLSKEHEVNVSFSGQKNMLADGFATLGSASNIAIRMYEQDGVTLIVPDAFSKAVTLNHANANELHFVSAAEKDESGNDITEGDFTASVNFNLTYN